MLPPIMPLNDPKTTWRERMKLERRAASKARPDAAVHAARNFLETIGIPEDAVVSLYYPIKDELDTEPLVAALVENDTQIALPVVIGKNLPLEFRRYSPGDKLVEGSFGELIPAPSAPLVDPAIIVLPLLGFSREGGRLGYGGGYYDRTLASLREKGDVLAVAYAFGAQQVDALPLSPLDQPVDWIVTEREAIRCA